MSGFFILVAGIICFVIYAVILIYDLGRSIRSWNARRDQRRRHEHAFLPEATIARDLVPKLEPLLPRKPVFYVTSGDGHALQTLKRYPWKGFIDKALKSGSTINYIFTCAEAKDAANLREVSDKMMEGKNGTLNYTFVTPETVAPEDRTLVESFRTFHPTLVEVENDRFMWIEGYHPPKSTIAYACEFVPPEVANTDSRFNEYKDALDHLIRQYGSQPVSMPQR